MRMQPPMRKGCEAGEGGSTDRELRSRFSNARSLLSFIETCKQGLFCRLMRPYASAPLIWKPERTFKRF